MRRLRVLQFIASSRGGGAAQVRDLALGVPNDRFDVLVAMPDDGGDVGEGDFDRAGIRFLRSPAIHRLAPAEIRWVRRVLREHEIDILHVHGARAASCGRLAVLQLRKRPKVVYTIHGFAAPSYPWIKRLPYFWLERLLQRVTDATVCVAQAEADAFMACHLARDTTLHIVYCGIDVDRFVVDRGAAVPLREELRVGGGPVVVTACRLDVPRDFESLLAAFVRVRREVPDARLVIAGDGPKRGEVEALRSELLLEDAVCMVGFRRDIDAVLALADVFVLTSDGWEGLPVSALEAQAAAVPVVITDAGGSREAVVEGETGFVTPRRDPAALSDALLRLLREPDLRRRLGMQGSARVRARFSRERLVRETIAVYDALA
jgi:glycosyltransferase involved in cell wall biosynthesis